jgi:hypothetical protein
MNPEAGGKMASNNESGAKGSKKPDSADAAQQSSTENVRTSVRPESEKTAASLGDEIKRLFDSLAKKAAHVATAAAETTASVTEKVAIKEPANLARSLLREIKTAGERSLQVIGDGFDGLRRRVSAESEEADRNKKDKGKGQVKKKQKTAPAESKAAPRTADASAERVTAAAGTTEGTPAEEPPKKTTKKKATAKKKVAKKPAAKKAVAKKKATAKTTARKKAAAKKTPAKKRAAAASPNIAADTEPSTPAQSKTKP